MGKAFVSRARSTGLSAPTAKLKCSYCGSRVYFKPNTNRVSCSVCCSSAVKTPDNGETVSKKDSSYFFKTSMDLRNTNRTLQKRQVDDIARSLFMCGFGSSFEPHKQMCVVSRGYFCNDAVPCLSSHQLNKIEKVRKGVLRKLENSLKKKTKWFNRDVMCRVVGNCLGYNNAKLLPMPYKIKCIKTMASVIDFLSMVHKGCSEIYF